MKKYISSMIAFIGITAFVLLSGCSAHKSPTAITTDTLAKTSVEKPPVQGNNDFAFNTYAQLKSNQGNVFFSPFSLFAALSMTYEGAKNKTADEMQAVLYLQKDNNTRWQNFMAMFGEINSPNKHYTLSTADNLWLNNKFPLLPGFLNVTGTYYDATATALNFVGDPAGSIQTINNAVSGETQGKITNLLPAGSVNGMTALVLTNAIYFDATWASQFSANSTTPDAFTTDAGAVVQPETMHQLLMGKIEDYYGQAKVLELPYVSNELSMFIFLPPAGGMPGLEGVMTGENMNAWMAARTNTAQTQISLSLPKFKFSTNYDMSKTLIQLGMPTAFSQWGADFSGMSSAVGPNLNLYISDVFHDAYVAVDEKGTEAAAATAVVIGVVINCVTVPPPPPEYFTVDHPFMFLIQENATGTILFLGKVNDPTAS